MALISLLHISIAFRLNLLLVEYFGRWFNDEFNLLQEIFTACAQVDFSSMARGDLNSGKWSCLESRFNTNFCVHL